MSLIFLSGEEPLKYQDLVLYRTKSDSPMITSQITTFSAMDITIQIII